MRKLNSETLHNLPEVIELVISTRIQAQQDFSNSGSSILSNKYKKPGIDI